MRFYLDSSVALHAMLPWGDSRAVEWFDSLSSGDELFSSTLLEFEVTRVLRRESLDVGTRRAILDRLNLFSIADDVLRLAAEIEHQVRTLDSIHLATASMLGAGVTVVTHDTSMRVAASQLGLAVSDPIQPESLRD